MRPKLHRYCARMTGSVIDGEDVLQDALIKAVEAHASAGEIGNAIENPEGWLFRIAHNTALDFLRRRQRQEALRSAEEVEMIVDQLDAVTSRQIAGASLRTFMRLPVAQRSSVILMDVLGCSLQEVCAIMECSLPAAKAALHRGRTQLRAFAEEPEDAPQPSLSDADRARLGAYVAHFNARDFDAIRAMIADDVRLELVSKTRLERQGRSVALLRQLFRHHRLASGAGDARGASRHPGVRSQLTGMPGRNISCCWAGPPARSRPSGISAMRLTSSRARNIGSEFSLTGGRILRWPPAQCAPWWPTSHRRRGTDFPAFEATRRMSVPGLRDSRSARTAWRAGARD